MEMREKERVDYIYFACAGNGRRKVTFQREEVAGIFVLKLMHDMAMASCHLFQANIHLSSYPSFFTRKITNSRLYQKSW